MTHMSSGYVPKGSPEQFQLERDSHKTVLLNPSTTTNTPFQGKKNDVHWLPFPGVSIQTSSSSSLVELFTG